MLTTPPRYFDRKLETLGRKEIQELRDHLIEDTLAVAQDNHFYSSFYARAGVDYVSVGALTHSSPYLDLGLDLSHTV